MALRTGTSIVEHGRPRPITVSTSTPSGAADKCAGLSICPDDVAYYYNNVYSTGAYDW